MNDSVVCIMCDGSGKRSYSTCVYCSGRGFHKKLEVGKIIKVKAWWIKDAVCEVEIVGQCAGSIYVKPLSGNPHMRSISEDYIVEEK